MQPFTIVRGTAAPLPAANVDTDVIMPKQFLKGIDRSGLDRGVFFDLRFLDDGAPNPAFILNQAPWNHASFLITGPNFGCGSSREHAVWGLKQLGIRALIGTSFAGIFYDNCQRNGVLLIQLEESQQQEISHLAGSPESSQITIDLHAQQIHLQTGKMIDFQMDPLRKKALLEGLDAIGTTLEHTSRIRDFEAQHHRLNPWLA